MGAANTVKGHSFSIEMPSRNSIDNLSINGGSTIEGDLGDNISFEIIEGIMLDIRGERRLPPRSTGGRIGYTASIIEKRRRRAHRNIRETRGKNNE